MVRYRDALAINNAFVEGIIAAIKIPEKQ